MTITETIYQNVLEGDAKGVEDSVIQAIKSGIGSEIILKEGLILAMDQVGKLFEEGEFYVPEMLVSARAMQGGLRILKPLLVEEGSKSGGRVAVGTVEGDLHDIGKNLVVMMFEGAGFDVIDLGVNVPPAAFVKAAQDGAQVIGLSALLTTTMSKMQTTIEALKTAGVRDRVKIIIGGAPVTKEFANSIGADAYATDGSSAARTVREMLG